MEKSNPENENANSENKISTSKNKIKIFKILRYITAWTIIQHAKMTHSYYQKEKRRDTDNVLTIYSVA